MDKAARDSIRQRIDSSRPEDDDALSEVAIMELLDALDSADTRAEELENIIEENVPWPWCPKCEMECHRVDDCLCCLVCETDVISPTSHHVARVAKLEQPQVGHVTCPECEHEFDFQTSPGDRPPFAGGQSGEGES